MFDYVFFDLDGTLTRSGEGIKRAPHTPSPNWATRR